jgi:hypothetical protein
MLKATIFYNEIRSGSSLPLLVGANDTERYVVKPYGNGDGVMASIVEWLASKLGIDLGLPILEPVLIDLDPTFSQQAADPETKELIEKSPGINLATRFLEGAVGYRPELADTLESQLKADIFLFDLFCLNIDRTLRNPNILWQNQSLWCIDYSSSLTLRSCINAINYQEATLLPQLKKHIFYDPTIDPEDFVQRLTSISSESIKNLVYSLPESWIEPSQLESIAQRLSGKKNQAESLYQRLEILKTIMLETPEQEHSRLLKNRQDFEAKVKRF